MRRRWVLFTVICATVACVGLAEAPLTNDDVIKLRKAGFDDDLIIAKIASARQAAFDVSPDSLIALKNAGLSPAVLDAMMRRTGSEPSSPAAAPAHPGSRELKTGVVLVTREREHELLSIEGTESSTYVYVTFLLWNNYPGPRAEVRTSDPEPFLLVTSEKSPVGRFYLVRLDSNPRSQDRSLKMGRSGMFTSRSAGHPDNTWTIPFETTREREGVWKLKPKSPLKPDEYGLWINTGELYDFAVD